MSQARLAANSTIPEVHAVRRRGLPPRPLAWQGSPAAPPPSPTFPAAIPPAEQGTIPHHDGNHSARIPQPGLLPIRARVWAILMLPALLSCVPKSLVNDEGPGGTMSYCSLTTKMIGQITLDYQGSLQPEFGEDSLDSMARFVVREVSAGLADSTWFSKLRTDAGLSSVGYDSAGSAYEGIPGWLLLPDSSEQRRLVRTATDYSLLLQRVIVSSHVRLGSEKALSFVPAVVPVKPLRISCVYVVWDNRRRAPLIWGTAGGVCEGGPAVTLPIWNCTLRRLARDIVRQTPFQLRPRPKRRG